MAKSREKAEEPEEKFITLRQVAEIQAEGATSKIVASFFTSKEKGGGYAEPKLSIFRQFVRANGDLQNARLGAIALDEAYLLAEVLTQSKLEPEHKAARKALRRRVSAEKG